MYAAEIALALDHLHSLNFVYRDLKPENILIDRDGHMRITDFGLVKSNMGPGKTTSTFCGTAEYLAPEVVLNRPYAKAVDLWALGVLMFEMMAGNTPWYDENVDRLYKKIVGTPVSFPGSFSASAKDVIGRLLEKEPSKRMTFDQLRESEFFRSVNWDAVLAKTVKPECVPPLRGDEDLRLIDPTFTSQQAAVSYEDPSLIDDTTQRELNGFTWVAPSLMSGLG
jgi:serine/threonine protein kinase